MEDLRDDLYQQRLLKLNRIRARGIDPYPARFHRTHSAQEVLDLYRSQASQANAAPDTSICLAGRIVSHRPMGRATFSHIQDGSGRIQIYFRQNRLGPAQYDYLRDFDIGDFIGVTGKLFETRTGEVTLEVHDFVMLAKALRPLPEKWHGLLDVEKRYRQRYLDLVSSQEVRRIFVLRSQVVSSIRRFLDSRGFLEVETPVLQAQAGGAMARPFLTYHNALERDLYLRIATELHLKRLIVGGFDKVYEIGRVFRNEGISTKHNPEYTLLESYAAYADYNDVMEMVEQMVLFIAKEVLGKTSLTYNNHEIDLTPPWRRLYLRQALMETCGVDFKDYPDADSLRDKARELNVEVDFTMGRGKIIDQLTKTYVEPTLIQPTFLMDYPMELSPLAKRKPDDPDLVERFEGFVGGELEMANAYTELNDPLDQRQRFRTQLAQRAAGDEEAEMMDEDYLVALEHGMPPTGGLGLGIDRLVMLLANERSIREVILFPQLRSR